MPNHRYQGPYRQSLLKLYSECPRKFKLLNVDGVEVVLVACPSLLPPGCFKGRWNQKFTPLHCCPK